MYEEKRMMHYDIDRDPAFAAEEAMKLYFSGKVFIYPTDTIYGIGANPFNEETVNRVSMMKRRAVEKKYILLAGSIDIIMKYVSFVDERHIDFLHSLWPNPVTVVLPLNPANAMLLNTDTIAFRIPNQKFCRMMLQKIGMPLISTSVNRHDEQPLNDYMLIREQFGGEVDAIFHTTRISEPVSSTVISLTGMEPILLRKGKFTFEEIHQRFSSYMKENQ